MRTASSKPWLHRHPLAAVLSLLVLGGLGWAALAPIEAVSHEQLFEIPRGTYAHRAAGQHVDIFPQTIRLTLGLNDVMVLENGDDVPHIFGPTIIMPGQSFRLPFETAATYSFECTAHPHGGLSVIVDPAPAPGWGRFSWRWRELTNAV
jgi:hypothetical protein